jgi:hypothetical protein
LSKRRVDCQVLKAAVAGRRRPEQAAVAAGRRRPEQAAVAA